MVKRPFASDVRCRETRVSTDVATTTAPARGWLSGPVTLPVMISVVAPTWATAERPATAAVKRVSATRRAVTPGAPFTVSPSGSRRTPPCWGRRPPPPGTGSGQALPRSEEHTSELQSQSNLVCRLLLEKKKKKQQKREDYNNNTEPSRDRTAVK